MPRSRVNIVSDILEAVRDEENCKKTRIIRLANLDWDMAVKYLNVLVGDGFLETDENDAKGNEVYRLTEKGELFLQAVRKLRRVCSIL